MNLKEERQSNIELMRIISIIMIVMLHYNNGSMGGSLEADLNGFNLEWTYFTESLCIYGVNIFVFITGYFSINNKTVNIRKCINLYLIMIFYGIIFYIISIVTGMNRLSAKELFYVFFPFLDGQLWFLESYIILMLLSPFINLALERLKREEYIVFLCIWGFLFVIWPTFLPSSPLLDGGYGITQMLTMYFIAGYIRRYISKYPDYKFLLLGFLICTIVIFLTSRFFTHNAWKYYNIFNIIGAICVSCVFIQLKIRPNYFINKVAKASFGVYLIHVNISIRDWLWQGIFKCQYFYEESIMPLHSLITVLCIFIICTLIDIVRENIWENSVDIILNKLKLNMEING